jgi:hypothetical protein
MDVFFLYNMQCPVLKAVAAFSHPSFNKIKTINIYYINKMTHIKNDLEIRKRKTLLHLIAVNHDLLFIIKGIILSIIIITWGAGLG